MPDQPADDQDIREQLIVALQEIARLQAEQARPPVADNLLLLFGRIAGLILVCAIALTAASIVLRPEADITGVTNLLSTQLSLIIGAVLGWAAHPSDQRD